MPKMEKEVNRCQVHMKSEAFNLDCKRCPSKGKEWPLYIYVDCKHSSREEEVCPKDGFLPPLTKLMINTSPGDKASSFMD